MTVAKALTGVKISSAFISTPPQGSGTVPTPIVNISPTYSPTATTPFNLGDPITIPVTGKYLISLIYDVTGSSASIDFTITRNG